MNVRIRNYGEYRGRAVNYGTNTMMVEIGDLTLWFSYQTLVAFQIGGQPRVVRKNDWGVTTGKHLDLIDGGNRKARVDAETFEEFWRMFGEFWDRVVSGLG